MSKNYHFETLQLHVGQEAADPATDARAVPIYASTSYVFHNAQHAADRFGLRDPGNIYSRLTNPTQDVFERRIAALEGGSAALAVASGAAALSYTIQALAAQGEHIVASKTIYGGTYNYLAHTAPLHGITTTFVDPYVKGSFAAAITEQTKALFIESLGNPHSNVIDIEELAKLAHAHRIPLVVDSTFATPYLLRPFEYGADIVIHSATKFIGGHGTAIGGSSSRAANSTGKPRQVPLDFRTEPELSRAEFCGRRVPRRVCNLPSRHRSARYGSHALSVPFLPLPAGLETLSLRVERHVENALKIVKYLDRHPQVEAVHHPSLKSEPSHRLYEKYFPNGGGSIFTFEIKGTEEDAKAFYRQPRYLFAAGKRCGRQVAGHPSRLHNAFPAQPRGTARSGHQAQHDPPFDRHRARGRSDRSAGKRV
jgi:O-acetylhomoserine (thiol)-lyase